MTRTRGNIRPRQRTRMILLLIRRAPRATPKTLRATRRALLPIRRAPRATPKTPRATRRTLRAIRPRPGMPVIHRRALTWRPFRATPDQPPEGAATGAAERPTEKRATFLPVPCLMVGLPPSPSHPGAGDNGPIGVAGSPAEHARSQGVRCSPSAADLTANGVQSITLSIPIAAPHRSVSGLTWMWLRSIRAERLYLG